MVSDKQIFTLRLIQVQMQTQGLMEWGTTESICLDCGGTGIDTSYVDGSLM